MKILHVIPDEIKTGLEEPVAADRHPQIDYNSLAGALRAAGDEVEMLDYAAARKDPSPITQLLLRTAGKDVALAWLGFVRSRDSDAVLTNGENVSIPYSLLLKTRRRRPRHVTQGHRLTARKKEPFFRWLGVAREMDRVLVYTQEQRDCGTGRLSMSPEKVDLFDYFADTRFYRPLPEVPVQPWQVCAAGVNWRDYSTLLSAVTEMPDVRFCTTEASLGPLFRKGLDRGALPENVDVRAYSCEELRRLYAGSAVVAIPMVANDFAAGVTSTLEAMAMGKAVVVTGTVGISSVARHGENCLTVPPGDVQGWRAAIRQLCQDPELRDRLGRNAREWVAEHRTLDRWVERMISELKGVPAPGRLRPAGVLEQAASAG